MIGKLLLIGLFVIGMVNGQFLDKEVNEAITFYRSIVQECLDKNTRISTCAACLKKEFALYDPIYRGFLIKIKPALGSQYGAKYFPTEEQRICHTEGYERPYLPY